MGTVDLADVRPCHYCGVEVLHVRDVDGFQVQVDPHVVFDGSTVAYGWRFQDGRRWVVHLGSVSPHLSAFRAHDVCVPPPSPKGQPRMTQPDPFGKAAPPGETGPDTDALQGKLLLLSVHSIETGVATKYGPADAVKCDIVNLETGETHTNNLIFGQVITKQLAGGVKYVGRIGKGQASGTNSPPWVWNDGDENDKATAVKYLTYQAGQSVGTSQPTPAAEPTPAPAAAAASPAPPWAS